MDGFLPSGLPNQIQFLLPQWRRATRGPNQHIDRHGFGLVPRSFSSGKNPEANIVTFTDDEAVMLAVSRNEIDAGLGENPAIETLMDRLGLRGGISRSAQALLHNDLFSVFAKARRTCSALSKPAWTPSHLMSLRRSKADGCPGPRACSLSTVLSCSAPGAGVDFDTGQGGDSRRLGGDSVQHRNRFGNHPQYEVVPGNWTAG